MTKEWFNGLREVESVPKGYRVWNIGKKNGAEFDPNYLIVGLFDENFHGIDFVKIRTERAGDIYDGVSFGYTLESLEKYVNGEIPIKDYMLDWYLWKLPKMKIALEAMKTIQWD